MSATTLKSGNVDGTQPERVSIRYADVKPPVCAYGNPRWHDVTRKTARLVEDIEPAIDEEGAWKDFKPIEGREKALHFVERSYVRYVTLLPELIACLARLVHPQKRALLKKTIESVAGRLCELKKELITLDMSLINDFTDIIQDYTLVPSDLQVKVPPFWLEDRKEVVEARDKLLVWMIEHRHTGLEPDKPKPEETKKTSQTTVESKESSTGKRESLEAEPEDEPELISEAPRTKMLVHSILNTPELLERLIKIQRLWKVWIERRQSRQMIRKLDEFLGMVKPTEIHARSGPESSKSSVASLDTAKKAKVVKVVPITQMEDGDPEGNMQKKITERRTELDLAKNEVQETSLNTYGLEVTWNLQVNITQWLLEMRDLLLKFPQYPEVEEGGGLVLFANKTIQEVAQELEDLEDPQAQKLKEQEKKKAQKEAPKKSGKKDEDEEFTWTFAPSTMMPSLNRDLGEYADYWFCKDEWDNVDQRYDKEVLKEQTDKKTEDLVREAVDAVMRQELERMCMGIDREKPVPAKKKAPKADRGGKKKKTNDPTAEYTLEELYADLVLHDIVKMPNKVTLDDFLGDANYNRKGCVPTAPEIRDVLRLLAVMPLSCSFFHINLPMTSSILLAGPPGVGKTTLVHAICREAGANLIDLSPVTLAKQHVGPKPMNYFMNVLLRVGKAMEPTVFMVDECDLLFTNKISNRPDLKGDKPQRWAGLFLKMMKKIKPGDRMLFVGITNNPFAARTAKMCQLFQNVIFIPKPDYGTRELLWKEALKQIAGRYEVSEASPGVLVGMTDGYSGEDVFKVASELLQKDNKKATPGFHLSNVDLVMELKKLPDPDEEETTPEVWFDWYMTTPLMMLRDSVLNPPPEEPTGKKKK